MLQFGYLISQVSDWSRGFVGIITHHAFFLNFELIYQDCMSLDLIMLCMSQVIMAAFSLKKGFEDNFYITL